MQVSGWLPIFLWGCGGGAALELLRWWKLRESDQFPRYARHWTYWLLTVAMVLVGGFLATAYGTGPTTAVLALNIGAAAPAIIGALAATPSTPAIEGRSFDGTRKNVSPLRRFLAFR